MVAGLGVGGEGERGKKRNRSRGVEDGTVMMVSCDMAVFIDWSVNIDPQ